LRDTVVTEQVLSSLGRRADVAEDNHVTKGHVTG
jgi:hypothetical protein